MFPLQNSLPRGREGTNGTGIKSMIQCTCPSCGKEYTLSDDCAGKQGACSCGNKFSIPHIPPDVREEDEVAIPCAAAVVSAEQEAGFPVLSIILPVIAFFLLIVVLIITLSGLKSYRAQKVWKEALAAINEGERETAQAKFLKCIELRPEWPASYLPAAALSYEHGDTYKAQDLLAKLVSMKSAKDLHHYAYSNLAAISLDSDSPDLSEAEKWIEQALEQEGNSAPAHVLAARLHLLKDDSNRAAQHISKAKRYVTDLNKAGRGLFLHLGVHTAFASRKHTTFIKNYNRASEVIETESFKRDSAVMALELLLSSKKYDKEHDTPLLDLALTIQDFVYKEDKTGSVQKALAAQLFKAGKLNDSVTILKDISKSLEGDEKRKYQSIIGKILFLKEDYTTAAVTLEQAFGKERSAKQNHLLANINVLAALFSSPKAEHVGKAVSLYHKLIDETEYIKGSENVLRQAIAFCDRFGRTGDASEMLRKGLTIFPGSALLQRRMGADFLADKKFKEAFSYFERSLSLNPDQPPLKGIIDRFKKKPAFVDFRPSKRGDFIARPLIHIRIVSGTPLPIRPDTIKLKLDNINIKFVIGGNECFYIPEKDLKSGKHTVEVSAEDEGGNAASEVFTFSIDKDPPIVKLVEPRSAAKENRPRVLLNITDTLSDVSLPSLSITLYNAPDNQNGTFNEIIRKGAYRFDDKEFGFSRGDPVTSTEEISFRVPINLQSGKYIFEIKAKDTTGNKTEINLPFNVRLDDGEKDE